jgi:hypothetical protein
MVALFRLAVPRTTIDSPYGSWGSFGIWRKVGSGVPASEPNRAPRETTLAATIGGLSRFQFGFVERLLALTTARTPAPECELAQPEYLVPLKLPAPRVRGLLLTSGPPRSPRSVAARGPGMAPQLLVLTDGKVAGAAGGEELGHSAPPDSLAIS